MDDIVGNANVKRCKTFRLVPQDGVSWPMGQELHPHMKRWRGDDIAAVWIRGVQQVRTAQAAKRRHKTKDHKNRGRGATDDRRRGRGPDAHRRTSDRSWR